MRRTGTATLWCVSWLRTARKVKWTITGIGSTVDVKNATWTNTIGAPLLSGFWKDPDFDPAQLAFYYVRVIEIPTPTWQAYDAKRFGVKMPDYVPMTVTNRAYTSSIWYSPKTK